MKKIILFLAILGGMTIACSDDDSEATVTPCTDEFVPGLIVKVTNGTNGAGITEGITVTASDGTYIEELDGLPQVQEFRGAGERVGTYTITVTGNGYEPYVSEAVTVTRDDCHVITQVVNVALTPAP